VPPAPALLPTSRPLSPAPQRSRQAASSPAPAPANNATYNSRAASSPVQARSRSPSGQYPGQYHYQAQQKLYTRHSRSRSSQARSDHGASRGRSRSLSVDSQDYPNRHSSRSLSRSRSPLRRLRRYSQSRSSGQPSLSRSRSRSHSPPINSRASVHEEETTARKRYWSTNSDTESSEELNTVFVKAQKITNNAGRPKASDYNDVSREVILKASSIYRSLISTASPFPTSNEELSHVRTAWDRANHDTAQPIPIGMTPIIGKIVSLLYFFFFISSAKFCL